ncbi:hypothetical protein ARHIZOSPH14_11230 [Agromyces rhizosphaerae]|uniref:Uncharacterized protein n=1 Tax=Agromyces rhizosphaerae TaxID=88374 RepID=A0A9W6FNU9_9MICO|nr:hypothetical protein ARHIZOSPH14_11230 [Agromyces rhizosphaerae]
MKMRIAKRAGELSARPEAKLRARAIGVLRSPTSVRIRIPPRFRVATAPPRPYRRVMVLLNGND